MRPHVIAWPVVPRARPGERLKAWRNRLAPRLPADARVFQILFLASLLLLGVLARDFTLRPEQMALTFMAALATQALFMQALGLRHRGVLSAVVTAFGLSILLRADSLWVHPLAAALAIAAKFVVRVDGKHLYNPANLGVIAATTLLPGAWISPGQWGNDLAFAALFVALGGAVTARARRVDIAWVFLGAWLGLVALRVVLLGQPSAVWAHQLGSGALMLFAFFMISDPMTIPNATHGRILYAILVACIAYVWAYVAFRPNALPWALFIATPLVPWIDKLWPGPVHAWRPDLQGRAAAPG
ncbi:MAG TPA: RnfABCDGE type electron transport complex subunit D [Casimicrobiaceae bacterium]|nr:RnfABCDGE type electron transport complex subunit D [Casimicrobiaceae bacterium]